MRTSSRLFRVLSSQRSYTTAADKITPAFSFKFDRAEANRRLAKESSVFEQGSYDKHQTLPEVSTGDPVSECFIPCHSADMQGVVSEYTATYGINRFETHYVLQNVNNQMQMVPQTMIITDLYSCSGKLQPIDYPFGTVQTQFYAGYEYPRALIEPVIRTPFVGDLKPLTAKMLNAHQSRKIVQPHEMTRVKAIEKIVAGVTELERERIKEDVIAKVIKMRGVRPDGGITINTVNVTFNKSQFRMFSYFVGVYVYKYPYGNFNRYKFLNAHNGTVNGNKVLSVSKFTSAGAIFGGLATLVSSLAAPYSLPIRLSIQIAIGAGLGGVMTGGFARLFNQYDRYHFVNDTEREKNENAGYPRSSDDKERQRFADEMNRDYEFTTTSVDSSRPSLPREKLSLLGLDPNAEVTLDMLHKAYINRIKTCHPDHVENNLNHDDAVAMTQAINLAYAELKSILELHNAEKIFDEGESNWKRRP